MQVRNIYVVLIVAMISYVDSQDTFEHAPSRNEHVEEMMVLMAELNNKVTGLEEIGKCNHILTSIVILSCVLVFCP